MTADRARAWSDPRALAQLVLLLALGARCTGVAPCGPGECGGPADGGGGGADGGLSGWRQETLDAHDSARRRAIPTPSPPLPQLTWSAAAEATAQAWAERCAFEHNPGRGAYGENIYASSGSTPASPAQVVAQWTAEASSYDYATNTCSGICGHYTQVVWRNTTSVGCGFARCTSGSPLGGSSPWSFWVCDYAPPGNFAGQRPY